MRVWAVHAVMKKKPAQKSASSPIETTLANGILKTSVLNFGTCSMVKNAWAKTSVYSQSPTGQRWTFGNTSYKKKIAIPELYFAKERNVIWRHGSWLPMSEFITLRDGDEPQMKMVRFRTLGDITITGGQESEANTLEKIVQEVASSRQTERGNREDDKRSESAMEDRKRQGYF